MDNNYLQHYGVKGMKWGVRKKYYGAGTKGIVPEKPKGEQPSWKPKKSERQKRWEDNHGINPNRPNGTKNELSIEKAIKNHVKSKIGGKAERKTSEKHVAKESTTGKKIGKVASKVGKALQVVGTLYVADVTLTGGAVTRNAYKTGKKAAKNVMNKIGDSLFDYSILDKAGKVIRRYN